MNTTKQVTTKEQARELARKRTLARIRSLREQASRLERILEGRA